MNCPNAVINTLTPRFQAMVSNERHESEAVIWGGVRTAAVDALEDWLEAAKQDKTN
jgi:hypothetical protein